LLPDDSAAAEADQRQAEDPAIAGGRAASGRLGGRVVSAVAGRSIGAVVYPGQPDSVEHELDLGRAGFYSTSDPLSLTGSGKGVRVGMLRCRACHGVVRRAIRV
jgi:hypothetical protein